MVIVNFIRDKEVGLFARAKRLGKGRPLEAPPGIGVTALCSGKRTVDDSGVDGLDIGDLSDEKSSEEESDKYE